MLVHVTALADTSEAFLLSASAAATGMTAQWQIVLQSLTPMVCQAFADMPAHCLAAESNEAFLVSAGGAATGMTLKCVMADPQAVTAYPTHQAKVTAMRLSQESRYLVQGFGDGVVRAMQCASSSHDMLGNLFSQLLTELAEILQKQGFVVMYMH